MASAAASRSTEKPGLIRMVRLHSDDGVYVRRPSSATSRQTFSPDHLLGCGASETALPQISCGAQRHDRHLTLVSTASARTAPFASRTNTCVSRKAKFGAPPTPMNRNVFVETTLGVAPESSVTFVTCEAPGAMYRVPLTPTPVAKDVVVPDTCATPFASNVYRNSDLSSPVNVTVSPRQGSDTTALMGVVSLVVLVVALASAGDGTRTAKHAATRTALQRHLMMTPF